jgi:hypothetical protein
MPRKMKRQEKKKEIQENPVVEGAETPREEEEGQR